jgi:dolichyl-phosphate-mannose-protein mannosyltransferase
MYLLAIGNSLKTHLFLGILKKNLGLILCFFLCIIALISFDEYGISWDEETQRKTGIVNYEYVFSNNQELLTWFDRDYGVAFELPLIILEKTLNLNDSRDIFFMRHLVTHLFFLVGCFFFFLLIDFLYKNKLLATIGFFLIILHPRIYGHSFFNTKDIPFLTMFMISMYFTVIAFKKRTILNFILLGICVGLLVNIRIMGIMMFATILTLLIIDGIVKKEVIRYSKLLVVFIISSTFILYATWPFLWTDPINNFILVFKNMSQFRWDSSVLFKGEFVQVMEIDWSYIPIWFSITTPIGYLLLGLLSSIFLLFQFIKNPLSILYNNILRHNLIFFFYAFAPIIAVIVLHSVLYDGWRQLFFIYPPFALLVIYWINYLKNKIKWINIIFLVLFFITTSFFMINSHPFQHVYFNQFVTLSPPEYIRKHYELDYWGTSYKQSLEYILKTDQSPSINICFENTPGRLNINILPAVDRNRLNLVELEQATYFISNYRWHPQDYDFPENHKMFSITVHNNTISQVYKITTRN